MNELERIKRRIKTLPMADLAKLRAWLAEFDAQAWDRQIEADSVNRNLDGLIEESRKEHKASESGGP